MVFKQDLTKTLAKVERSVRSVRFCLSVEHLNLDVTKDFQFFELYLLFIRFSRLFEAIFIPLVFLYRYPNLHLFEVSVIGSKLSFSLELRINGAHY